MEFIKKNTKWFVFAIILIVAFLIMISRVTYSGLWQDEAVEYFFSKYMTGVVPGGTFTNMYERICSTFQPPLYNFLMFFYLQMFDSELSFRVIGVIVTLIGSVGVFKTVDRICKGVWFPNLAALFYLFIPAVEYYAIECGEYYFMLCFTSWTIYFFVKAIDTCDTKSIIGFFIFACLAVYSQYGAVFIIGSMYIVLFIKLFMINKGALKKLIIITLIVGVVFVLPLIVFFLIPQMTNQSGTDVSHAPVFIYNVFIDYFWGIVRCIGAIFGETYNELFGGVLTLIIAVLLVISVVILIIRHNSISGLTFALLIAYSVYFVAVVFSFYAYNPYLASYGSYNLALRYCLFLTPALSVIIVVGANNLMEAVNKSKALSNVMIIIITVCVLCVCTLQAIGYITTPWIKDDIREATVVWYKTKKEGVHTLVNNIKDAPFQYYLRHDERYRDDLLEETSVGDEALNDSDTTIVKRALMKSDCISDNEFYYVSTAINKNDAIVIALQELGFNVESVYNGQSGIIHVYR